MKALFYRKCIRFVVLMTVFMIYSVCSSFAQGSCSSGDGSQFGGLGSGGERGNASNANDPNAITFSIREVAANDPNDIIGPIGFDTIKKWVSVDDRMNYTIRFENDPNLATAPAKNVFVYMPISNKIDINSLELTELGFNRMRFSLPAQSFYGARLDVRDSLGLYVDVTTGLDVVNKKLFLILRSVDPATGLSPAGALSGFLPVNDTTATADSLPGRGEGFLRFSFKPLTSAVTGDTISHIASIVFDDNDTIPTNRWKNTVDAVAPTSSVLSAIALQDSITVGWRGNDDLNGSGLKDYTLYVSENNAPYQAFLRNVTDTVTRFRGRSGSRYCFYVQSRDNTGNTELLKNTCEQSILLSTSNQIFACGSYTLPWGGVVTTSGIYTRTFVSSTGSDSTVTLNVVINQSTVNTINVNQCGSYNWNGKIFTTSGTYSFTTNNAVGCDSLVILMLTVTPSKPLAPASITQTLLSNVCGNRVYRYTAALTTNATSYAWDIPLSVGGITGVIVDSGFVSSSRVIKLRYASNAAAFNTDSIKVIASNVCGNSPVRSAKLVNAILSAPATPVSVTITPITTNVCTNKLYRYTAPTLPTATATATAATGWQWSFTGTLGQNAIIDSGNAGSQIIRVRFTSNATAGIGDSVKLLYTSACGNSTFRVAKLTNIMTTIPVPASITITPVVTNICGNRIYRYTAPVLPVGSATTATITGWLWSFTGTLGQNATLDSASLSDRIMRMKFSSNNGAITGDSVKLQFTSTCGNGAARVSRLSNVALNPPTIPATITITPISTNICGAKLYRYSAPNLPLASVNNGAATGWTWSFIGTLGNNASIDSGNNNSQIIRVKYTSNAASVTGDSVKLIYQSLCGNSPAKASKLTNTITTVPIAPTLIGITPVVSNICGNRVYRYTAPALTTGSSTVSPATGWQWSFAGNFASSSTVDSGSLTSQVIKINFSNNSASGVSDSVRLHFTSSCGNSLPRRSLLAIPALANCPSATTKSSSEIKDRQTVIEVFPNPSKKDFTIIVKSIYSTPYQLKLMDIQGRRLVVQKIIPYETFTFGDKLPAGKYVLEISNEKEIKTTQVIKL